MLNYNVTEANRNQAFREAYVRLVIAQFGGGVQEDVREKVFGVADPPATIEDVLKAATAVENEKHAKATKLVVNVVQEEQDSTEDQKGREGKRRPHFSPTDSNEGGPGNYKKRRKPRIQR